MKNSFVIGVTGGIGSGKSSVARLLAYYCLAPLIDLDLLCRDLLAPGGLGSEALSAAFGQKFFDSRGQVDRAKLRQFLFADFTGVRFHPANDGENQGRDHFKNRREDRQQARRESPGRRRCRAVCAGGGQ